MAELINSYYDNRELSWLKFNKRVLEEAQDKEVPLFERLRFVSIFSSNLDEFFMVRVGSLHDQTLLKNEKPDNKTNLSPREQLDRIADKVSRLIPEKDRAYKEIMEQLRSHDVEQINPAKMSREDKEFLDGYFTREILPLLSPQIIDKNHPLPFLRNKEVYVGLTLKRKNSEKHGTLRALIPVTATGIFERLIYPPCSKGVRFVLIEDLIMHYADRVFPDHEVVGRNVFRITRNADIDVKEALFDHDLDFRDVMEEVVKKRKKLAPVRIEFGNVSGDVKKAEIAEIFGLELGEKFVFVQESPLDFGFVGDLGDQLATDREIFYEPLSPQTASCLTNEPMMKQIERKDILLSYPFESFKPFIDLLEQAAETPEVVSIKITLYRVARDSKIVNALIKAAENGKDVLALVELRARFDEENNIGWSKRLEEAGVKIIYGLEDLKVHSKLLLITKRVGNSIQYITQVGTGNYNERTSKLYTDITLMTADHDIGTDASMVFNALSIGSTVESSTYLWVAPHCLKSRVVEMIDREITYGKDGYIGIKMNSLTDKDIIDKLVQANEQGVKIELLIRGICCLIGGIPGKTENITVTSIVGRFLEHSRIYIFGRDDRQKVLISSADFMTRNTERRVEVGIPIRDKDIKERIVNSFNTMLKDNVKARVQGFDGVYRKKTVVEDEERLDTQVFFYKEAYRRAREADEAREKEKNKGLFKKLKNLIWNKRR
ncbi:MAG: polyphosphate kinase 1 [Ruminiclostridium sp.]